MNPTKLIGPGVVLGLVLLTLHAPRVVFVTCGLAALILASILVNSFAEDLLDALRRKKKKK